MKIGEYSFGSVIVNGKKYNYDVEVRWNGEVSKWQRQESHIVDLEDVKESVEQRPEIIIIGTGYSGIARVTEKAQNFIKEKGIGLIIDITAEAVKTFNMILENSEEEGERKRIIGLFHLTC